jgi:hypothetical protein
MNVLVDTSHEDAKRILDCVQVAWATFGDPEVMKLMQRYAIIVEQTRD